MGTFGLNNILEDFVPGIELEHFYGVEGFCSGAHALIFGLKHDGPVFVGKGSEEEVQYKGKDEDDNAREEGKSEYQEEKGQAYYHNQWEFYYCRQLKRKLLQLCSIYLYKIDYLTL